MTKSSILAILTDIEGTTTPFPFVHEVLFPYITQHLESFINTQYPSDPDVCACVDQLYRLAEEDQLRQEIKGIVPLVKLNPEQTNIDQCRSAIIENVRWQMKLDRKTTALKALQGLMWMEGYTCGDLKGQIYPDVVEKFREWKLKDLPVYIYSSGSIQAQKLLFQYSEHGNMIPFISGHFDTTIGAKSDPKSYQRIAEAMELSVHSICFLSDNPIECTAAKEAGMQSLIVYRAGNPPLSDKWQDVFNGIQSFGELPLP